MTFGSRYIRHRSRHWRGDRPSAHSATAFQSAVPLGLTAYISRRSSSAVNLILGIANRARGAADPPAGTADRYIDDDRLDFEGSVQEFDSRISRYLFPNHIDIGVTRFIRGGHKTCSRPARDESIETPDSPSIFYRPLIAFA
jgi:hypothetical protein